MKLLNSKLVRGSIAITNMEWFCGEFEEQSWRGEEKPRFIGCVDVTIASNPKPIFFITKGQPPETFDFKKDAFSSFEQIAMAQITVMEWDKLKNGDRIRLDEDMEKNVYDWGGHIWMGGSITEIEKVEASPDVSIHHLKQKKIPLSERVIEGRHLRYKVKHEEY